MSAVLNCNYYLPLDQLPEGGFSLVDRVTGELDIKVLFRHVHASGRRLHVASKADNQLHLLHLSASTSQKDVATSTAGLGRYAGVVYQGQRSDQEASPHHSDVIAPGLC